MERSIWTEDEYLVIYDLVDGWRTTHQRSSGGCAWQPFLTYWTDVSPKGDLKEITKEEYFVHVL